MARTIVVLCDVHLEQGKRVKGEELPPIAIDGKGPRVLALCARHRREYYDPFLELVDDLGEDVEDLQAKFVDQAAPGPADKAEQEDDGEQQDGETAASEDPDEAIAKSPAMSVVPDQPETARWDCPLDDCDKSYSASGDTRAEDLKRLGNLHLATSHNLDKAARQERLSA